LACQVKSNFGQVLSFRSKLDPTEGLKIFCRVNLWMKLADIPPGVKFNELARIPASINMAQSNVVKEFPLLDVYSVGKVNHVFKFELATMAGYFNSYGARFRLNCLTKTVDEINAAKHVSIPADLYGRSFPCLATSTFEKCREIHDRTLKMLSRKSQGQMKTHLDRIHMNPKMWWMLVYHLRLSTPSHAVCNDDKKMIFNTHSLECTTGNTLQMRSHLHHDRQVSIHCRSDDPDLYDE
jgi:hypothetical protein